MEAYWGTQAQEQAGGSVTSDEGNHEGVVGGGVVLILYSGSIFYFKMVSELRDHFLKF